MAEKTIKETVEEVFEIGEKSVFETLSAIDVSEYVEQKSGLNYLSWTHAWGKVKALYPDATYDIIRNEQGLPYFLSDEGAMVYTTVTIKGITHMMWLFAMNGANKSLKKEAYTYKTKYADKEVEALTMFDVNKTLMRCLVKNLAMFGLGINIYANEDLPIDFSENGDSTSNNNGKKTEVDFENYKLVEKEKADATDVEFARYLTKKLGKTEKYVMDKYDAPYLFTTPYWNGKKGYFAIVTDMKKHLKMK